MTAKCPEKAAAKAAGKTTYEGRPCSKGHGTLRYLDGKCVVCNRLGMRTRRAQDPAAARRQKVISDLRVRYGLTEVDYERLFAKQHGKCAICECPLVSCLDDTRRHGKGPDAALGNVDHDHVTKVVRGLLCAHCNHALGKFRDDEQLLLKAVEYLRASATQHAQPVATREVAR